MLAIGSLTASSMVATPPVPAGRAFAKTLPGVTAPLGYFVRCPVRPPHRVLPDDSRTMCSARRTRWAWWMT